MVLSLLCILKMYNQCSWKFSLSLFVFLFHLMIVCGYLNIEELQEMQYALEIMKTPVSSAEVKASEGLQLASKHGQRYYCKLPNKALEMADQPPIEERLPADYPLIKLLEPLRNQSCLKLVKGWWTYEFCHMKYLQQYHSEDGKTVGDMISLGEFHHDFDWNDDQEIKAKLFNRKRVQKYHTQYYINGTDCNVLRHKRDTEVRYYCDESASAPFIARVDEPFTCSYIVTIKTHLICSHPHTKLASKSKADGIICQPLLSKTSYQRYVDQQTKSAVEAYAEANALLRKKRDKLRLLLAELKNEVYLFERPPSSTHDRIGDSQLPARSDSEAGNQEEMDNMNADAHDLAVDFIQRFVPEEKIYAFSRSVQVELLELTVGLIFKFRAFPSADLARIVRFEIKSFIERQEAMSDDFFMKVFQGLSDNKSNKPGPEPTKSSSSSPVKIKVRHLHSLDDEDLDDQDPVLKELEEDIERELKAAGVSSKTKIEVHLVTSDSGNKQQHMSKSDAHHFKEALLELMGGGSSEERENERLRRLSESYNMMFEDADARFVSRQKDNEDNS